MISLLNRNPVFIRGKYFHFVYFGLFAALGAFCALGVASFYLCWKGTPLTGRQVWVFPALIGCCWLSARVGHFVALGKKFFEAPGRYLRETSFYVQGAIYGVLLAGIAFPWMLGIPVLVFLDALAWGAWLALFFGRLGCFNYGCCWGVPTAAPWGIAYRHPQAKVLRLKPSLRGVPLHPVQLYTALADLFFFGVATFLAALRSPDGTLTAFFFLAHGGLRIFLSRYRDLRNFWGEKRFVPNVAWITLLAGMLLCFWIEEGATASAGISDMSSPAAQTFISSFFQDPAAGMMILLSSLLVFIGYGYHGRELGTFVK